MFEIATQFMLQLVECIPVVFTLYIIFDFTGSLLFGKR